MSILDELREKREARASAMARESAQASLKELEDRRRARQERITRAGLGIGRNIRWLFGLITALVCGWSLYSLGRAMNMPGWVGILAAATVDGAWLYCLLHTHLNRDTPYRALGAHTTSQLLLLVSIALNLMHGLVMFSSLLRGLGAGLLFALFPVILKVVIAQSTQNPLAQILKVPGGRDSIRQMGRDRARSALQALQERDRIERYQLERTAEVELARLDLRSEFDIQSLQAALEASPPAPRALPEKHKKSKKKSRSVRTRPDSVMTLSTGNASATAPTGQDTAGQRHDTLMTSSESPVRHGLVYKLVDPRDQKTRYIGKTIGSLEDRLSGHVNAPASKRVRDWIIELESVGLKPGILPLARVPLDDLDEAERDNIWLHEESGADLLNSIRYVAKRPFPVTNVSGAALSAASDGAESKTLAKLVRDFLDQGVKPENMVDEVQKVRPWAKDHSIIRTCARERSNHI